MGENARQNHFAKNINGLLKPSRGKVKICGQDSKNLKVEEVAQVGFYPKSQ